jgi:TonB family protein
VLIAKVPLALQSYRKDYLAHLEVLGNLINWWMERPGQHRWRASIMSAFLLQIVFLFVLSDAAWTAPPQEEKIYTVSEVHVKPQPVKGLNDFQRRWSSNVTYPEEAVNESIEGMVFIEFVVNPDGAIVNPTVKSGLSEACDEAAMKGFRVVSKESWKPALKDGQPVKVKMVLPFAFRIIKR